MITWVDKALALDPGIVKALEKKDALESLGRHDEAIIWLS
jgi:hypothetical protein